jgi:hypothetical protein
MRRNRQYVVTDEEKGNYPKKYCGLLPLHGLSPVSIGHLTTSYFGAAFNWFSLVKYLTVG